MLRRIFYSILAVLILLAAVALYSCDKATDVADDTNDSNNSNESTSENTEPPTPEPETDPPAPRKINKWLTFAETDIPEDQHPIRVGDGGGFATIGAKFTVDFIMTDIIISCPSWSDDIGTMVFKIYKWDTDYETTAAGDPILIDTETFVDYPDNDMVEVIFPEEIEPGTYLWELSEGKDGVGLWAFNTPGAEGLEFYKNQTLFTDGTAFNAEINGYIMSE